jgi:hypothetical protein
MPLILKHCQPTVAAIGGEGHRTLLATFQQTSPSAMKLYQSIEESQNLSCLSLLHMHCLHKTSLICSLELTIVNYLAQILYQKDGSNLSITHLSISPILCFQYAHLCYRKKFSSSASISMHLLFQRKKHFLVQYGRIRLHPSNM